MPVSQTRYLSTEPGDTASDAIRQTAAILRGGGLVAFPTETVYGLGVLAENESSVRRLYEVKLRPEGLPLTVHLADAEAAADHVPDIPPLARRLMERYWPGPLTLVLTTSGGGTVGLRVPSHELARQLLRQVGASVVATSANPHGRDPAVDVESVRSYFDGSIDAVLEGGRATLGQASTIVRVEGDSYKVLREGIITHEMVHQLLVGKSILFVCTGNSCRSPMAAALFGKMLAARLGCAPEDLRELGYSIQSAGVFALPGSSASENAIATMREHGIDLTFHRTRQLTLEMITAADRIYALSASHLFQIVQNDPSAEGKTRMLKEGGVLDPIGGDLDAYRACARDIESGLQSILESF